MDWNQWFTTSFRNHIDVYARVIAEAISAETGKDARKIYDEIARLKAEVAALKGTPK